MNNEESSTIDIIVNGALEGMPLPRNLILDI